METTLPETVVLCPACGHHNTHDDSFCELCRTSLERGMRVTPEEAREVDRRRRQEERRQRITRWTATALITLAIVAVGAFIIIVRPFDPNEPQTNIAASLAPGDWPMFQRDPTRSAYAPDAGGPPEGEVAWTFQTNAPLPSAPAVVEGVVYLGTGDHRIVALDADSGRLIWEVETTGPVDSHPAVAGGFLYVGLRDGRILALDADTGGQRWEFQTGDLVYSSPAVHEGVVYVGSADHKLYALDALDGDVIWSDKTGGRITTAPSVVGERVVVNAQDRQTYVYNARTGNLQLDYSTSETGGAPALSDSLVYVSDTRGTLVAIDLQKRQYPGEKLARWARVQLWVWGWADSLPVPKGFHWMYRQPREDFVSTPALDARATYIVSDTGNVHALDRLDGERLWTHSTGAEVKGSPIVAGDVVYVADLTGKLHGLDAASGEPVFEFDLGDRITSNVTAANDMLFVPAESGALYAVR